MRQVRKVTFETLRTSLLNDSKGPRQSRVDGVEAAAEKDE
jgi:hypothetical protein